MFAGSKKCFIFATLNVCFAVCKVLSFWVLRAV